MPVVAVTPACLAVESSDVEFRNGSVILCGVALNQNTPYKFRWNSFTNYVVCAIVRIDQSRRRARLPSMGDSIYKTLITRRFIL